MEKPVKSMIMTALPKKGIATVPSKFKVEKGQVPQVLRVGVIGIGLRGNHSYEQTLKKDLRVQIVAVSHYDSASEILAENRNGKEYHKQYSKELAAEYYSDYRCVLSREDIDLIVLMCEPNRALELGKECIDAGKHVLRDKPATKNPEDSFILAEYAKKRGKMFLVALPLRYYPILQDVRNTIRSGQIGDITTINMGYIWTNGPLQGFTASQDYVDAYGSGDVLTAGYHAVDYLNWIINSKAVSVYAHMDTYFYEDYRKLGIEDFGQISIQYENGVIANLVTGRCTAKRPGINWLDISGTSGAIDVRDFRNSFDGDPLVKLGHSIVDAAISKNYLDIANGYEAAMTGTILKSALRSSQTGSEQRLSLDWSIK
jgi:predicted dehydrogenase